MTTLSLLVDVKLFYRIISYVTSNEEETCAGP